MSIILAVLSLVLLRNRLAVEQKRPWLVKAQNSLRPSASRHSTPAQIRTYRVGIYLLTGISESTEVSCTVDYPSRQHTQRSVVLSIARHGQCIGFALLSALLSRLKHVFLAEGSFIKSSCSQA